MIKCLHGFEPLVRPPIMAETHAEEKKIAWLTIQETEIMRE